MINPAKKLLHHKSRIYLRILQLLGFAGAGFLVSCVKYGTPEAMYGVPENTIHFYGRVQSADSLKNIPGIQIRLVPQYAWDSVTSITQTDGSYSFYYYANEGDHLQLKLLDNDSSANLGWFANKIEDISISSRDFNNHEKETNVLLNKK